MRPLEGLFVLDFSTLLPGPLATLLLAEAEVEIEIEIEAEAVAVAAPEPFDPPIPSPVDAEAAPDEADTTAAPSGTRP